MVGKCLIISGGEFFPIQNADDYGFIIACDRGYEYAKQMGIVPDLIVGDFDSYDGKVPEDIPVKSFVKEKDDTDTMIAIRYAVEKEFAKITLICALGKRLDHTIGNIQAAAFAAQKGIPVWIPDKDTYMYIIANRTLEIPKREGFSFSLLSLSDSCSGVSLEGFQYPLQEAVISNSFPIGISNEWAGEIGRVTVGEGTALIILSKIE